MSDEFLKYFGFWGTIIGLILSLIGIYFSVNAWIESKRTQKILQAEKQRLNEKIKIILTDGKNSQPLPSLRRQDVTRSEVQGRLGTIPMLKKGSRYSIEFLSSPEFIKQIDQIAEETGHGSLVINCSDAEFNQFDLGLTKTNTKKSKNI